MTWEDEYKAKMREFIAQNGVPVWLERADDPEEPVYANTTYPAWMDDAAVSPYGWRDWEAYYHAPNCAWVVPEGAKIKEVSYSEFQGTFTSNADKVGVNIFPVHCACGEFERVVLRWSGSLTDILESLLDDDDGTMTL